MQKINKISREKQSPWNGHIFKASINEAEIRK